MVGLEASRVLLVNTFAATGPVVMGLDDTIERRRGAKIKTNGATIPSSVISATSSNLDFEQITSQIPA